MSAFTAKFANARRWSALALVSAACCTVLPAAAQNAQLRMSVTIPVLTHGKVHAQPGSVQITPQDIRRGYVEVAAPVEISVRNNNPAGYLLVVAGQGDFIRQIRLKGLGHDVQLGAEGGVIARPALPGGMQTTHLSLGFRLELGAQAEQGVYPWPLQVSAAPL